MKRLKYLILFVMFLPIVVKAYDFKCGGDNYKYGDEFKCNIVANEDELVSFDEFSGEILYDDKTPIKCVYASANEGFMDNGSGERKFSLKGKPTNTTLVTFSCTITEKPIQSKLYSLTIDKFRYHEYDSNLNPTNDILRSNNVTVQEYKEDAPVETDTRPRKTDNPDSRLRMIAEPQLEFSFSGFQTIYDLEVLFEVEKLELQVVPVNSDAVVEIKGSQELSIGDNVIDIYVKSPDGTSETCYTLNIKRLKRGESIYYPKKDATLSKIEIDGYPINFESVIKDYTINIPYNVNYINIIAEPTNEQAKVLVSNSENLKDGSIINISVTSEDGSETEIYLIHIKKGKAPFNFKPLLIGGALVLSIVVLLVIIIKTNQKNRKDPLLKLRGDKRGVNFGKEFDSSKVAEIDAGAGVQTDGDVNKIDLSNVSKPIEMDEVLDDNMNKTVSVVTTLDLSNATLPTQIVAPQPVQQAQVQTQPVQQVVPQPAPMPQPQVQPTPQPVQPVQPQAAQPVQAQPVPMPQQPVQQPAPQPVQEQPQSKVVQNGRVEQIIGDPSKESNIFD